MWLNLAVALICAIPMIFEIITDYRDWKIEKRDKKLLDVILIRVVAALPFMVLSAWLKDVSVWQSYVLMAGLYIMFFDFAMGWLIKKNPFYFGQTSKIDKLLAKVQIPFYGWIIFRGILFGITIQAFYDLKWFVEHI